MDLASRYDVIVLGTGLVESLLAAAAATSGKTVLQLDAQDFYGGRWATLSIDDFLAALRPGQAAGATGLEVAGSTDPACIGESHAFLVDLAPRLVYGGGPMVDALLASGAHHYTEFKLLQGSYMLDSGDAQRLTSVPSTRAEVFASRDLSLADKRVLMRFLQRFSGLLPHNEGGEVRDPVPADTHDPVLATPFADFMTNTGLLRADLRATIAHGALLLPDPSLLSTGVVLDRLALLQRSAGRYGAGSGALLCPMHGGGELAQAFCRSAAVGGAVQMLRSPVVALRLESAEGSQIGGGAATVSDSAGPKVGASRPVCTGIYLGTGDDRQEVAAGVVIGGVAEIASALHLGEQMADAAQSHPDGGAGGVVHGAGQPCGEVSDGTAGGAGQPCGDASSCPSSEPERPRAPTLLRCVAVLDAPALLPGQDRVGVCLPRPEGPVVWMLALGHTLCVCPENRTLVYLWTEAAAERGARSVLEPALQAVLRAASGTALFAAQGAAEGGGGGGVSAGPASLLTAVYYTEAPSDLRPDALPSNVTACPDPGSDVAVDSCIASARQLFHRTFGEEGRFPLDPDPPAPDAEDVASDEEALEALRTALRTVDGTEEAAKENPDLGESGWAPPLDT
uniref:Rab proteins geranylgeranyltransferase component A n=1 Tax=Auxenochlorella protothecoides TaxID=3075 RepID=A0A1D1ZYI0_AUXPR